MILFSNYKIIASYFSKKGGSVKTGTALALSAP